jgi:hypothetical protein
MMPFFEISFFLFAIFSAAEEVAFTFPFREISDEHFSYADKKRESKKAHRSGAFGVLILLVMSGFADAAALIGTDWNKALAGLLTFSANGFIYWLVFDCAYSLGIDRGLFYLGNTPATDGFVVRILGKNAGAKKAVLCIVVIIAINLIYQIKF